MSNQGPVLLLRSAFSGGFFFTLWLRQFFLPCTNQIKSKPFHVFYAAVLWFLQSRLCSVAILCFYRVIPSLSYMYNLVFNQCLLSGESARIRILMGLSTIVLCKQKKVRACALRIFALKMVLSSAPKNQGWKKQISAQIWLLFNLFDHFSPHSCMAYLAIEHELLSGRWGKEMVPMQGRWGASGGGTKSGLHKLKAQRTRCLWNKLEVEWTSVVKCMFWSV